MRWLYLIWKNRYETVVRIYSSGCVFKWYPLAWQLREVLMNTFFFLFLWTAVLTHTQTCTRVYKGVFLFSRSSYSSVISAGFLLHENLIQNCLHGLSETFLDYLPGKPLSHFHSNSFALVTARSPPLRNDTALEELSQTRSSSCPSWWVEPTLHCRFTNQLFYGLDSVCLGERSTCARKRCILQVLGAVFRSGWFKVVFKSSVSLLTCLEDSISAPKPPTVSADLSI